MLFGVAAAAQPLPTPLEQALTEAETAGPLKVSFTLRFQWPGEEDVVQRFDAAAHKWKTLEGNPEALSSEARAKLQQVKREECRPGGLLYADFRSSFRDVREAGQTGERYIYSFRARGRQLDEIDDETQSAAETALHVNKEDGAMTLYAVRSQTPMKLNAFVRMEEFVYEQNFRRVSKSHPPLLTRIYNKAVGERPLKKINQEYTVLISDHEVITSK
jgi:hypothetical protein